MNQKEKQNYLIQHLKTELPMYAHFLAEEQEERMLLRALMNLRGPGNPDSEFLRIQDEFLWEETLEKEPVELSEIPSIRTVYGANGNGADVIAIWKGDITRLKTGAIVNAANSQMLGCFVPCHRCIDNAIHSAAGINLREACNHYMEARRNENPGYEEPEGSAMMTLGYNIPADYVIHTVGPMVSGLLREHHRKSLALCYESCLDLARKHQIKSIAFCCISTGEFRFPNEEAAVIALKVMTSYLEDYPDSFDKIIINVFKEEDLRIYEKLVKTHCSGS